MKVRTHVKLAQLAFDSNSVKIPKGFSKFMFNFGLVMIDQSWHVKTHPHYMQKSFDYITKKIDELSLIDQFNGYYSMQLGIVVHYLCDFCCYAHITGSIGNVRFHLDYERKIQRYLLENYPALLNELNKSNLSANVSDIKSSLVRVLEEYKNGSHSYFWDIKKCTEASYILCYNIFNIVSLNSSNTLDITLDYQSNKYQTY